jgi:hypothetical protein
VEKAGKGVRDQRYFETEVVEKANKGVINNIDYSSLNTSSISHYIHHCRFNVHLFSVIHVTHAMEISLAVYDCHIDWLLIAFYGVREIIWYY